MTQNKLNYYKNQALKGGNLNIRKFQTSRRQKGYGFLTTIAKRFAIPVIKFLGQEVLKGGSDILSDIIPGVNIAKKNLKRKAASTLKSLGEKIEQSGIGRKRKRKSNSKKSTLKGSGRSKKANKRKSFVKKDIFKTF